MNYSPNLHGYITAAGLRQVSGYLDLILKVTVLYVGYLLNQWLAFLQTYTDISFGQAEELM